MTSPALAYRKLPGRGLGWTGRARLWVAADHLLEVTSLLVSERYRRFIFKDITALVILRTKAGIYWNIAHGILGLGGTLLAGGLWRGGALAADRDTRIMLWVFAGMIAPGALLFLILLCTNILLGPTCRCHLQTTTAGWHPLAAPTRLRAARRFLAQITSLVEQSSLPGSTRR